MNKDGQVQRHEMKQVCKWKGWNLDAKYSGVHFEFSNLAVRLKIVVTKQEKIHSKELKYTYNLMRILKDLMTMYAINS